MDRASGMNSTGYDQREHSQNSVRGPKNDRESSYGLLVAHRTIKKNRMRHLSPLQKFKKQAEKQIEANEKWVERITTDVERQAARQKLTEGMKPPQKISVKKELANVFAETKSKITSESQILKDRVEIQERVEEEKNYTRKMSTLKKMLKECPTMKAN